MTDTAPEYIIVGLYHWPTRVAPVAFVTVLQELDCHNRGFHSARLALTRNELHPMEAYLVRQTSDQMPRDGQEEVIRQIRLRAHGLGVLHNDALTQSLRSKHAQHVVEKEPRVAAAHCEPRMQNAFRTLGVHVPHAQPRFTHVRRTPGISCEAPICSGLV